MNAGIQRRYEQNCKRWSLFCPQAASLLPAFESLGAFTPQQFTQEEVLAWAQKLDFSSFQLLYVYGLSEALPYLSLKKWCSEENHYLIILEDNLETIAHYFTSEEAEELLSNKGVWLTYLDPIRYYLGEVTKLFPAIPYAVATIHTKESKLKIYSELKAQIAFFYNLHTSQTGEFRFHGMVFFTNYYCNLLAWPQSYLANHLYGKFQEVPAIICGAGPSLGKNIETLKTLKERALIFAGGTAMNALNGMGMTPHFGLGIDPNEECIKRIIVNTAFEIPYLFRGRHYYKALDLTKSEKLYVTGSIGYNISKYFERECGIEGEDVEEGCNVINFSLALAAAMGCNPIILVGVDLAYSGEQAYAPGMVGHPIHKQFRTKVYSEELIYRTDIYGNSVPTLWKWVNESLWFSNFAKQHSHLKIINATEGGIGFAGIPNIPLAEAAEGMLTESYGIGCRLFGEIQDSKMPPTVTQEKLYDLLEKLLASHENAHKILQNYREELLTMQATFPSELTYNEMKNFFENKLINQLKDESSYLYLLENFNQAFNVFKLKDYVRLGIDIDLLPSKEWQNQLTSLEIERTLYLEQTVSINEAIIKQLLKEKKQPQTPIEIKLDVVSDLDPVTGMPLTSNCTYLYENNHLMLIDPECNLNVSLHFVPKSPKDLVRILDEKGHLKFESYRKEGKLHGPSRFYSQKGSLLAESWYLEGLQEGKAFRYYPSGTLHSIQHYKQGLQHGKQEYFYEDRTMRILISDYQEGLLHGEVLLFHPNGKLARRLHFHYGKHDGPDLVWYDNGKPFIEAQFKENRPIGIARVWYANGHLAQQMVYNDSSEMVSASYWDETGTPIITGALHQDYFQTVASTTQQLTDNLAGLFKELTTFAPLLAKFQGLPSAEGEKGPMDDIQKIAENLNFISSAIKDLEKINEQLTQEASADFQTQTEAYWKTGALRKEVQEKLHQSTAQIQKELNFLRSSLKDAVESLLKKKAPSQKPPDSEDQKN